MDKTQYYIPCIKVQDLIKANYNLTLDGNKEQKILISTLISPLIDKIQRITGLSQRYAFQTIEIDRRGSQKCQKTKNGPNIRKGKPYYRPDIDR